MNIKNKYDPEDIEFLLLNKEFDDLYEEEKAFVLRHIESKQEYSAMRKALLNIHGAGSEDIIIEPDPQIRETLLKRFETSSHEKISWKISLNQLFAGVDFYRKPSFQLAFAAVIIIIAISFFLFIRPERTSHILTAKQEKEIVDTTMMDEIIPTEGTLPAMKDSDKTIHTQDTKINRTSINEDMFNSKLLAYNEVEEEKMAETDFTQSVKTENNKMKVSEGIKIKESEVLDSEGLMDFLEKTSSLDTQSYISFSNKNIPVAAETMQSTTTRVNIDKKTEKARYIQKDNKPSLKGRNLNTDAQLIDIFFTAL